MITEIRILSRGGQGGVTGAKLLAYAGFLDNFSVQAIPKYGAERKGAPIFADIRLSSEEILTHAPVMTDMADYWIILDSELPVPIDQAKDGAVIVFNARSVPEYARGAPKVKTGFVDATRIAQECDLVKSGTPLVNVAMLGAWAKSSEGLVSIDALCSSVEKTYGKGDLTERNIRSIRQAYDEFQFEE
ncbi:MAG: 2-oxoacid:acceptor oxidoreductase family protein [Promethearchaeota archaeon]